MEPNTFSTLNQSTEKNLIVDTLSTSFESPNRLTLNKAMSLVHEEPCKEVGGKSYNLTTKKAVEFLLNGNLKKKVCRYCLKVAAPLSELDQVLQVVGGDILYRVTIREMIASFHPIKVADDANFPNKICEKCLDNTISSYLFKQQCEKSERALRNCFEDVFDKLEKLDPLERQKKRGRQKCNPNHNTLYVEYDNVIDYAESLITVVNISSEYLSEKPVLSNLTCPKCTEVLPNLESLLNHEKSHPKSMLYHCQQCGKAFFKRNYLRRHLQAEHIKEPHKETQTHLKCQECGTINTEYNKHLQHIEKHKFKMVMEHLVNKNMDKLCAVCLNKGTKLEDLDKIICLHGWTPEMVGDVTLYSILGSTIPEMKNFHNYTGSKICEKCLNHAITSYLFIYQTHCIRNRLKVCINSMLDKLNTLCKPEEKVFIEISEDFILPIKEELFDENLILDNLDDLDESKLKFEVLEDEFRMKSESEESDDESKEKIGDDIASMCEVEDFLTNIKPLQKPLRTYGETKVLNGISTVNKNKIISDVCSEFLTFKKKKKPIRSFSKIKFTCPVCNKHFISEYFLRRHVLKHVLRKSECLICGLDFKSKFNLYEHTKVQHLLGQGNNISCEICGRFFMNELKLYAHEKCHRIKVCNLCDKSFRSQTHYTMHLQRHFAKLRILKQKSLQTCSFCEKECANDNDLAVHVNKVHLQIKPYGCDMCDRQFYTESNLRHHKIIHSVPSKETCEFCKKSLKCRRDLVIHVRKHIDSRPYTCQLCVQAFHSQSKLKNHMKNYHGGTFCCKLCKNVFETKNILKDHFVRVHSIS